MDIDRAALLRRYEIACDLKQPVDRERIAAAMTTWIGRLSDQALTVRFVETIGGAAWDAWDAWDARAAWAARDAWDARAARAARAAWDAWDARAAWAARDAWDARAAWAARDARDAVWESSWLSAIIFGAADTGDQALFDKWVPLFEAFEAGCFAFWITKESIVIATSPQVVSVDSQRRMHAERAPAFEWLDIKDYWHHGVLMPSDIYEKPGALNAKRIDAETNAEVRRVMIGLYGVGKYLSETKAKVVHEDTDQYGRSRRLLRRELDGDEPIIMVEVTNSTAEPDGEWKRYMLRVDPNVYGGRAGRECHAAIASTWRKKKDRTKLFFKTPEDYAPVLET